MGALIDANEPQNNAGKVVPFNKFADFIKMPELSGIFIRANPRPPYSCSLAPSLFVFISVKNISVRKMEKQTIMLHAYLYCIG